MLGKEERKKKWLTLPFIPMNMADIDYSGNGENGRTSNTATGKDQLEGSLEPKYRLELSYPPR